MKTFGYKTIMSFLGTLAMFYIITHNLLIVTTATLVLVIFTIFFVPLIKIGDNTIRIIPFNQFAKRIYMSVSAMGENLLIINIPD